jgi:hypothetical protein
MRRRQLLLSGGAAMAIPLTANGEESRCALAASTTESMLHIHVPGYFRLTVRAAEVIG